MNRGMRRKDKMLSEEEMLQVLNATSYGVLSTISEDGTPYGVPISYVYKDDKIYFHSALVGHKLDNITLNNTVSFCVVTDVEAIPDKFTTKFKSVIILGTVKEIDEDRRVEVFKLFLKKFSSNFMEAGVDYINKAGSGARIFQIDIEHISAKGKK